MCLYRQFRMDASLCVCAGDRPAGSLSAGALGAQGVYHECRKCLYGVPLLAVEVKYSSSLSGAVAAAVGQSLIYKLKYPYVIAFILHRGPRDRSCNEYDEHFWKRWRN